MASITPINTATDTPSSAAVKTNANELAINTEVESNTDKVGITPTQASDITTNNNKVTNATHTGDVTGATALTIPATTISGKTEVVALAGTEEVLVNEAGTLKKTTTQDIADLASGGGAEYAMISGTDARSLLSANETVPLSVEVYDTSSFISLSSNQFTLLSGTYIVSGVYSSYNSGADYGYIYNTSDSVNEYIGSLILTASGSIGISSMNGIITIASTKTFELRSGLGSANLGSSNVGIIDNLTFVKIA